MAKITVVGETAGRKRAHSTFLMNAHAGKSRRLNIVRTLAGVQGLDATIDVVLCQPTAWSAGQVPPRKEIPCEVILVTDLGSASHRRNKQIIGVSRHTLIVAAPKPMKIDECRGGRETMRNQVSADSTHEVLMPRIALVLIFLIGMLVASPLRAGEPGVGLQVGRPTRPVHTYSIVARDSKTGELGVAVQPHWFAIGPLVPWAEAGVGAVATQSFVDPSYGKLGLDMMRLGRTGPDALRGLLVADENRDVRQVAMIDSRR